MTDTHDTWIPIATGAAGTLAGVVGTIIVALINRQSPLAAIVDQRVKFLIEHYEKRLGDMDEELEDVKSKLAQVTLELAEERRVRVIGL